MAIVRKLAVLGLVGAGVPALLYGLLFGYLLWSAPLAYSELDFNGDGKVSLLELESARDLEQRPIAVGGQACVEIFARKDARTLSVRCQ